MALTLLLGGLVLLALPGLVRGLGRQLHPAEWVRLSTGLLVGGALVVEVSVVLFAAPTVLRAVGIPDLAEACERMLRPLAPGGATMGWSAAVVAAFLPVFTAVGIVRARRAQRRFRIESWLGEHRPSGDSDLVVLPTEEVLAFSVDGSPAQIVVSQGLINSISPEELAAVVRHEAAHLDHRHGRFLVVASAMEHAFAWLPFVARSTRSLRSGIERWADEVAAGSATSSRAVLRDALLGVTLAIVDPAVAAFGPAETVVERLDALDGNANHPSTLRRSAVYLPVVVVAAGVLFTLGAWTSELRGVIAMSGSCPVG